MIVVVAIEDPEKVGASVAEHYPDRHKEISSSAWVIATCATPREVGDRLGISEGETGTGLVAEIANYWGRAPTGLWPWMAENRWW